MKRLAALGAMKISYVLKGRVEDEVYEKHPGLLSKDVSKEQVEAGEKAVLSKAGGKNDPVGNRFKRFYEIAGNDIVFTMLELLVLRSVYPESKELLELVAAGCTDGVNILAAARAAGYTGGIDEAMLKMKEADTKASFYFRPGKDVSSEFFRRAYIADDYILGFFSGSNDPDPSYSDFSGTFDPGEETGPIYGMEELMESSAKGLKALIKKNEKVAVIIDGERESGRYTAAKTLAERNGISLLCIDFSYLIGTNEPKEVIKRLVRSSALEGRALCVRNIIKNDNTAFLIDRVQKTYDVYNDLPLFLITDKNVKPVPNIGGRYLSVHIKSTPQAALSIWKGYLGKKRGEIAESLASKMVLTAGQIKRVSDAMETVRLKGEEIDERTITRLCYEVLDDGRYENIKRVESHYTLDDVKIDDHNRSVLEDIVRQIKLRRFVYDGWNLKSRYAYGRCVSVILAGPPGTGKTMTVHALAGELGLELYKVDLSQIVDKYIGETEKRLEEVFVKAQKSNMILFFDEADAVMGKRSEVKDSKDKYANTEISYILQRIEEYDGIVLLATNNLQNIDQAFMRRIRYVVNYEMPGVVTREDIWRSAFGADVPLSDDIDYKFLAENFELSGGEIKNIVLNAVFYGAADGGPVSMAHIMKAVYRENTKIKRIAYEGDYGGYAYLLHD